MSSLPSGHDTAGAVMESAERTGVQRRGKPSAAQSAAITQTIIAEATEMFLLHGYDGTAMEAVAARVGIPKRTLYKRFADKRELLNAVLDERLASWSSVTSQQNAGLSSDLAQRLKQYVTTMLVWSTTAEVRAFTKLFASAQGLSGEHGSTNGFRGLSEMIERITQDIAAIGPAQGIQAENPLRVARILMALVSGWLDFRETSAPIAHAEAAEEAELLVDMFMQGTNAWR